MKCFYVCIEMTYLLEVLLGVAVHVDDLHLLEDGGLARLAGAEQQELHVLGRPLRVLLQLLVQGLAPLLGLAVLGILTVGATHSSLAFLGKFVRVLVAKVVVVRSCV